MVNGQPNEVKRSYTKYVFLDVVQFSKRSAEAQSEIISQLNNTVILSLREASVDPNDAILIPTGDGVCIGLIGRDLGFDTHIVIALNILSKVHVHNNEVGTDSRRFQLRVGINQNTDILFTDINGKTNIAGYGINLASRIMDQADGGQVLVSETVFQELQPSERYMDKFREFMARGKHDTTFRVYQYVADGNDGLNHEIPAAFAPTTKEKPMLSEMAAQYIAHAIIHRHELMRIREASHVFWEDAAVLLLRFLAEDAYDESNVERFDRQVDRMTKRADTFAEQYQYYSDQDQWLRRDAEAYIEGNPFQQPQLKLAQYRECFEPASLPHFAHFAFVSDVGIERLRKEWPDLFEQYGLESILAKSTSQLPTAPLLHGRR